MSFDKGLDFSKPKAFLVDSIMASSKSSTRLKSPSEPIENPDC